MSFASRSSLCTERRGCARHELRVQTLLPFFKRFWVARSARVDDAADPLRPGDVVLLDTFPSRYGPDHIRVLSERTAPSGLPFVINNWTEGTCTKEMDLLDSLPMTHRFRISDERAPR